MFKKYRQLILGFIIGSLIFTIIPVSANIQDYLLQKSDAKLIVDEREFSNQELPVLNYKGYNYIPASAFREICDTMEIGFEWVAPTKEIKINTSQVQPIIERKGDIMTEYITYAEISSQLPKGYSIPATEVNGELVFNLVYRENVDKFGKAESETVLLKNIPHIIEKQTTKIEMGYYQNTILPLIK